MAESDPAALTYAKDFFENMLTLRPNHSFASELAKAMTLVSASLTPKPRLVTRLTVTPAMCNYFGTLHGGAVCTLFDVCTTLALATARKWEVPGVTRTLSTTCLVPVFPGEEVEIVGELVQVGKKLAHILGQMSLVKNGRLVATCVHDKANLDAPATLSTRITKL